MNRSDRPSWAAKALRVGVLYLVAGIVFGVLAGRAGSHAGVVAWRLAAWVMSAIVFAAHVRYEHFTRRNPPPLSALHVAAAVAFAGFGLAVAAMIHALVASPVDRRLRLLGLALVAWPAITAVPAYVVVLVTTSVLARFHGAADQR